MHCFHSLTWSLTFLLPLQVRGINAQSSTTPATVSPQESSTANPICLQSHASTDPVAAAIQSSVTSDNSLNKACDPSTQQIGVIPWTHTFYVLDHYLFFNISLQDPPGISNPTSPPTGYPGNLNCILAFNAIFSSCVDTRNFWGGWTESNGLNYSISYTPLGKGTTSASSMSLWMATSSSLSQRSETASIPNGSPTTLGTVSSISNSNTVVSAGSRPVQGRNLASAQNSSTNLAGTGLNLPQASILGSGQNSASATTPAQPGVFFSGGLGSSAALMPTSTVIPSLATRTYTFDGIVFIGDNTGLTAGSVTVTPLGLPATLSGHIFSLAAAGSSIYVDGNVSPLLDLASTTDLAPGYTSAAVAPSIVASTGSVYTLDGVVLTGNPSSGLTVAKPITTASGQLGYNSSLSLMAANSVITPGGIPLIASGHTFSLPASATGGEIFVDGALIHLPTPTMRNSASPSPSQNDVLAPVKTSAPQKTGTESQSTTVPSLEPDTLTSTDTVQPSDASTEGITNTAISSNYWLTTQVNGRTTVVPVIVGCPGCGGKGRGIILWNFPPIPSVSFRFPKLNLPSISFPCIPIPLIKSCSKPPTSGSSSDDSKGPKDPKETSPPDSKPSETQPKETDSETSALSSATTSSISTSSISSDSACPLRSYSFSLPLGTDSTTLSSATGTNANTSSASPSASSSTGNSACPLKSYSFSLPPGTDSTTLSSASGSNYITGTNSRTIISQTSSQPDISTAPLPDCMADGRPWYSPTSWCDCGHGKYPTLPPVSSATTSSANCAYTSLDTSKKMNPVSTSARPECTLVLQGDEQGCANVDYCNCGGTHVGLLTTTVSGTTSTHCDYTIQPTKNDCPINTASVNTASAVSMSAAMSISAASVASVATAFSPDKTTLSCGQKYDPDPEATYTSVPRAQTNDILQNTAIFCTPSKNGVGNTLTFQKNKPNTKVVHFKARGLMLYGFSMVWDPRPECANIAAPQILDTIHTGPDYLCNTYFDAITNTCVAGPGENKNRGTMYAQCVIWSWQAWNGCTGKIKDLMKC